MSAEIPQSTVLAEASEGDSLAEVMSRDPEGFGRQDRDRIIETLIAQRIRIESAEKNAPVRAARGGPKLELSATTTKSVEDMGL